LNLALVLVRFDHVAAFIDYRISMGVDRIADLHTAVVKAVIDYRGNILTFYARQVTPNRRY
jgi:hypothetical protein